MKGELAVLTIPIPIDIATALELLTTDQRAVEFIATAPGVEIRITVASQMAIEAVEAVDRVDPPPVALPPGTIEEEQTAGGHVCGHCGRTFATGHGLTIHTARTHPTKTKMPETSTPREFRCHQCDAVFTVAQALGAHRRRQHPVAPKPPRCASPVAEADQGPKLAPVPPPMERRKFDQQAARDAAASGLYLDDAG